MSHLGAVYSKCKNVEYIPSSKMKDKTSFTTTSRRFVGVLNIDGIEYLTYHVSEIYGNRYIKSVLYDIEKENNYQNIIVFVNDIHRIKFNEFITGKNKILVIEDKEEQEEKVKNMNNIDWTRIIEEYYGDSVYFSSYRFCDYTDNENKFVSVFDFVDTEKINRIKLFLRESKSRNQDIICSRDIEPILRRELPNANYIVLDFEKYIVEEQRYYD